LAHDSIDDYRDAILHRNLFGPENHPPQLAPISSPSVKMGETVRFTAKATDADPLDTVTYRLDDAPQGATIGASDGKVQWKPPASLEPGKYELKVTATDDGMPRRSASTTVTVTIRPPQLRIARLRDQTIKPGDRVRLRVSLDERDPKAKVTFALAEGATIDRESGEFVWTPTAAQAENDRYEITVAAVDDAQPSRSDRATFRIVLQRPKVVPYVPDVAARHTFVTGILEVDGEPEVWLEVRTTGERPHLRKGDRLVAGNFRAVVAAVRIEPREVDFLRDGQLYTVELGRSLAEAVNAPTGGF
jgi:hypothetical protein